MTALFLRLAAYVLSEMPCRQGPPDLVGGMSGFRVWGFGLALRVSQTPGRIQKVDPLMGVPIKYP